MASILLPNLYDEYSRDEDDIHRNGIKCVYNEMDCEHLMQYNEDR